MQKIVNFTLIFCLLHLNLLNRSEALMWQQTELSDYERDDDLCVVVIQNTVPSPDLGLSGL